MKKPSEYIYAINKKYGTIRTIPQYAAGWMSQHEWVLYDSFPTEKQYFEAIEKVFAKPVKTAEQNDGLCELCGLYMEPTMRTKHHLVPKKIYRSPKNNYINMGVIKIHAFCHAMIHVFFSNKELAELYNSKERLKNNSIIQRYIQFIKKSPTDFYIKSNYSLKLTGEVRNKIIKGI